MKRLFAIAVSVVVSLFSWQAISATANLSVQVTPASSPPPATFVANFNDVHQTIDGFGASNAWAGTLNPPTLDALYCVAATDPGCSGPGIGLTLLRVGMDSTDGITQSDTIPLSDPTYVPSQVSAAGARAKAAQKAAKQSEREAAEREVLARMNRGRLEWKRSLSGNWYTEDRHIWDRKKDTRLVISPSRGWAGKWDIGVKKGEGTWESIYAWPSEDAAWEAIESAADEIHGWSRAKPHPIPVDDDDGDDDHVSIVRRS
jgi:hypothetical protein